MLNILICFFFWKMNLAINWLENYNTKKVQLRRPTLS